MLFRSEAAHADHAVQVLALLAHSPADPLVAVSELDGRRARLRGLDGELYRVIRERDIERLFVKLAKERGYLCWKLISPI